MSESLERSLLDEIDARIPAADFEAEYFPGGVARVTIDLTAEMVEQIEAVAQEQGWPKGEALVAVLALGLGALREERARRLMEEASPAARDELDLLVRRMRRMEMQYAVMKRRTWDFLKCYQAASLSDGALRTELAALKKLVGRLRQERDAAHARLRALERERDTAGTPPQPPPGGPAPASFGVWQRLWHWLRR